MNGRGIAAGSVFILVLAGMSSALAEVYKCVDPNAHVTTYSDSPCVGAPSEKRTYKFNESSPGEPQQPADAAPAPAAAASVPAKPADSPAQMSLEQQAELERLEKQPRIRESTCTEAERRLRIAKESLNKSDRADAEASATQAKCQQQQTNDQRLEDLRWMKTHSANTAASQSH